MYADCELYLNAKELGIIIDRRDSHIIFEHKHWTNGKREQDDNDKGYYTNWRIDEETWNKRKLMSLKDRLKV
jgi:hypothetical protein